MEDSYLESIIIVRVGSKLAYNLFSNQTLDIITA